MKRKSPTPSSTASFFAHQKILILEDGRDINSLVGPLLVKRIQENGGTADILKTASFLPTGKMLSQEVLCNMCIDLI
jgi:hypothetical protein